jgi:hypothetical protein
MKDQIFMQVIKTCASALAVLCLCVMPASAAAERDMSAALSTAGFKSRPAVTAAQRQQLRNLPVDRFTAVKQGGETYYLYPDKNHGRLFAGNQFAYRAFINNEKNNRMRRAGAFVYETNPADRATNKTVVIWHDWSPFQRW